MRKSKIPGDGKAHRRRLNAVGTQAADNADNREARDSASLSSNPTTSGRQKQARQQDREQDLENALLLPADLDAACTASAVVAVRLAATVRFLDYHPRQGEPFGHEVAQMTRMAMMAAEATVLLDQVARDYVDWVVTP